MGAEDTSLAALYAVINMIISILIGFILSKMDVLTPKTRGVVSAVNYYALIPIYAMMFICKAIRKDSLNELGYVLFSGVCSVIVAFIITYSMVILMQPDIRFRFAYTFVVIYQNIVVMPQMLADSLCGTGGKYVSTIQCKQGLVKPYSSLPFMYVNILYWISVLPILQNEKRLANDIKKAFITALNYYPDIENWLRDSDFSKRKEVKFDEKEVERKIAEKKGLKPPPAAPTPSTNIAAPSPGISSPTHMNPNVATPAITSEKDAYQTDSALAGKKMDDVVPMDFDNKTFILEFYGRRITSADYDDIMKHHADFERDVLNKPEHAAEKFAIEECILRPEKLLEPVIIDDITSWDFYKRRILLCPPAVWSIIGVILGFIFPFRDWFFDATNKPLPTFVSTLETIGGMMSPISMFMLGTYIAQAAVITDDMYIRWKHIIVSNLVRNFIMPCFGLLWIFVFFKSMTKEIYNGNPLLLFICFTYWIVPNGIILIAVYVVADYFAKEFAVISIYMNILSIPMMAIYLIIYFAIYEV
jgi:predicted permease